MSEISLWRVTAASFGWDEYDSFVVWARSADEALIIAKEAARGSYQHDSNFDVGATVTEELKPMDACVCLGSFNAG
ncbi:MAG: hypothetical protein E6Z83_14050 [Pantoea sp.]|uniref:hypothetical protein n=1 Tax=Pantoea sp. TaxID=69393 RepID=UPI00291502F1|nr:hypothetical protein [Pantoea sp.]MDU5781914.1 hypothetical protein [Pantoea sp.]